ncbi:MAG: glycosyltransferase family 2 protein [Oscillospiraceae bacterium]
MTRKTVSILIPTYNEEENARAIYEAVKNIMISELPEYDYEILYIDNKSTDKTRSILEEICSEDPNVRAIFNQKNFGQFNSPYYGLMQTTGDCTILLCADFQDPIDMIPKFVHEWNNGYQIVVGVKTTSKENPFIYFLRSVYYKLLRSMSNADIIEHFTGFGLYDRSFLDVLRNLDDPTPFIRGIVAELGADRKEIEYTQMKRKAGRTHNNFSTLYDAAMLSFTSYTKAGMRLATFSGFIIAVISFIIGLIFLILKLCMWDKFVMGYSPMLISIFFMGGMLLLFLGFLGEYVMAMNIRIMKRPLVVEEKRLNFPKKEKNFHSSGQDE